jgi:N-acetylmuramoyl-L-alanine amidase
VNPAGSETALKLFITTGDRSGMVGDVQARLRLLGLDIDDDPGHFGAGTDGAVRIFQQRRHILVDGIVGPHTWQELVEAGWRLGDRPLYLTNAPMRGDDVAALQARLSALGFDAGRADGIFGRDTDTAVRAFQREYDIPEDGIFGPRSLAALVGLRVDRPGTSAGLRDEIRRVERNGATDALVVVDPGHGGRDPGETGPSGLREADICWDLAERVADRLARSGAHVRFTRTEAESPDVTERARRANALDAELFLSLHLNAHPRPHADGASTYYFGGSRAGEVLAESIQGRLVALGLGDCRAHARSYSILKETRMPAVLVEPAFITSPDDERRLDSAEFRGAIAQAVATGVEQFYGTAPGH